MPKFRNSLNVDPNDNDPRISRRTFLALMGVGVGIIGVGQMFGDNVLVRELFAQTVDDQPQMLAVDLCRHIEPQPIGMITLKVHPRVLQEVLANLTLPPGRTAPPRGHPPALEIDASVASIAVEFPEDVVRGPGVVVDDVENHRQAGAMSRLDEPHQVGGCSVR
jgi:hypothetical protein